MSEMEVEEVSAIVYLVDLVGLDCFIISSTL